MSGTVSASSARGAVCTADPAPGAELLRAAFREHPAGVAVITAPGASGPVGFTATSLASVSAEPPLVSFNIGVGSSSWPTVAVADHVGVHILGESRHGTAVTFARSGADRFAPPTRWHHGPLGVPVLDGVSAWLVCRVAARIPAGDHHLVLAEVIDGGAAGTVDGGADGAAGGGDRPLLHHRGRFRVLRD